MLPFASGVNRFFRFRENSFRLRFRNRFLLSRGAFMLPFAFEVNNFFRFVKLFVSPWSQSFFFNREERLCSPSLQESTVIFRFREISFRLCFREPFPLVARSVYAPTRSTSQPFFQHSSN